MEQSYKEKYEQALEKIKNLIDKDHNDINVDDILNVFPELAESEDEKVRKELISFFSDLPDIDTFRGIPPSKVIAWLEKQKEYESIDFEYVWDRADCGELTAALDKYSEEAIINMCHAWYDKGIELERKSWLENQGEKHPDPYNGISFEYSGHIWGMCARDGGVEILMDGNITSRVFPDKNNIIEQKPTDSYCQENCKGFQETGKCFADGGCKAKREAEQKSAEENKGNICGISPNSAWSEEDEQHIDSLLKRLDALCRNKFERTRFAISEDRDWLKSLRPQNRWKPSELQLGCLSDAIEHYNSLGYPAPKLKELLDDLKKLKEGNV